MAIRNLKDNSKNPWLCECYPQGREGKCIRKRFTMQEIEDKPLLSNFHFRYTPEKPVHLTSQPALQYLRNYL